MLLNIGHYTILAQFVNLSRTLKSVKDSFKVSDYVTANLAALFHHFIVPSFKSTLNG